MPITPVDRIKIAKFMKEKPIGKIYYLDLRDALGKREKISDVEFLEFSKSSITVIDFLISSIVKVQKGHRLALGLDETEFEDTSPQINIIEGLSKEKIW